MPNDKRVGQIRKAAKKQGWTEVETKNGWTLRSPDGVNTVGLHRTPSDHRWFDNTLRDFRKGGGIWPPPKKTKTETPDPEGEPEGDGEEGATE